MPASPLAGHVYKTTEAQRARAAAQRASNPDRSRAYAKAQQDRLRAVFVGPRRPRGRQPIQGLTKREQVQQDRKARRDARDGQPEPQAPMRPRMPRAVMGAEEAEDRNPAGHRAGRAAFRAAFVGPVRPRNWRSLIGAGLLRSKPSKALAVSTPATRPPAPTKGRPKRPETFGPPAPPRAVRRAVLAADVAHAKAQAAQARATAKAAREWDAQSHRIIRRTVVGLKKLRTAERRLAWQREYTRRMAMTDEERDAARAVREAAQAKLNAVRAAENAALLERLRVEQDARAIHDAERMQRQAQVKAEAATLAATMRSPVRRTTYTPT